MYGLPSGSTASEFPSPTSSVASATIGTNRTPSPNETSASGSSPQEAASRPARAARISRRLDTSARILARAVNGAPTPRSYVAGRDGERAEHFAEEPSGVGRRVRGHLLER